MMRHIGRLNTAKDILSNRNAKTRVLTLRVAYLNLDVYIFIYSHIYKIGNTFSIIGRDDIGSVR